MIYCLRLFWFQHERLSFLSANQGKNSLTLMASDCFSEIEAYMQLFDIFNQNINLN